MPAMTGLSLYPGITRAQHTSGARSVLSESEARHLDTASQPAPGRSLARRSLTASLKSVRIRG